MSLGNITDSLLVLLSLNTPFQTPLVSLLPEDSGSFLFSLCMNPFARLSIPVTIALPKALRSLCRLLLNIFWFQKHICQLHVRHLHMSNLCTLKIIHLIRTLNLVLFPYFLFSVMVALFQSQRFNTFDTSLAPPLPLPLVYQPPRPAPQRSAPGSPRPQGFTLASDYTTPCEKLNLQLQLVFIFQSPGSEPSVTPPCPQNRNRLLSLAPTPCWLGPLKSQVTVISHVNGVCSNPNPSSFPNPLGSGSISLQTNSMINSLFSLLLLQFMLLALFLN